MSDETGEVIESADVADISVIDRNNPPPPEIHSDGFQVLDPTGATYFGVFHAGQKIRWRATGQWQAGPGQPYWGPGGDPDRKLEGGNMFAIRLMFSEHPGNAIKKNVYYYGTPREIEIQDTWAVFMVMNDYKRDDNVKYPADPMRCKLDFI